MSSLLVAAGTAPLRFDALVLAPVLLPLFAAVLVLLVDAVRPDRGRAAAALVWPLAVGGLLAGTMTAGWPVVTGGVPVRTACLQGSDGCLVATTGTGGLLQVGALVTATVVVLGLWAAAGEADSDDPVVDATLVLATAAGAAAVPAAGDLGSWLVALELATLPAIALLGRRRGSAASHGAVSLLTTSVLSFSLVTLGAGLWLVGTGSAAFSVDSLPPAGAEHAVVLAMAVLVMVAGVGFKVSAVPFHAWTPAAYRGAPGPVAALLATTSKLAAVAAIVVVLAAAAPLLPQRWLVLAVTLVAAASTTLGSLAALRAPTPIALLAWSSVAQAGWVVAALVGTGAGAADLAAGYALTHVLATTVVFAVAGAVGWGDFTRYRALLRSQPVLGGMLALGLASLAGLPPGLLGLVAKIAVLGAATAAHAWVLALVLALNAVLGVAVYLRWFAELVRSGRHRPRVRLSRPGHAAVALSGTLLIVATIVPTLIFGPLDLP